MDVWEAGRACLEGHGTWRESMRDEWGEYWEVGGWLVAGGQVAGSGGWIANLRRIGICVEGLKMLGIV